MWKIWADKIRDDFWFVLSWIITIPFNPPSDEPLDDWADCDEIDLDEAPNCYDEHWHNDGDYFGDDADHDFFA